MAADDADFRFLAGYFLGHPATGPTPGRDPRLTGLLAELGAAGRYHAAGVFADLEAALLAAERAQGTFAPQGLWLPAAGVAAVRDEVDGTAIGAMLARHSPGPAGDLVAAGIDVLGFGGDLRLSFAREDAGLALCRRLGVPPDPPPFLPSLAAARRLCAELNEEDLGAPVLWVCCWRTVHAAL